jgi:hypothetical protein
MKSFIFYNITPLQSLESQLVFWEQVTSIFRIEEKDKQETKVKLVARRAT